MDPEPSGVLFFIKSQLSDQNLAMPIDLSLRYPGRAYADLILGELILDHRDLHRLQILLSSQPVDLLCHRQRLRGDHNKIELFVD